MSYLRVTPFRPTTRPPSTARRCRLIPGSVLPLAVILLAVTGCRDDAESPTAPQSPPALATSAATALVFHQVSATAFQTCGVTTDHRAYCWGRNDDGELGDGTTTGRMTPVPVLGGLQFVQVEAGEVHTCGLTYPDRRAHCWGYGGAGALGNGTTTMRLRPVAVAGGRVFRQVSAGGSHTCGVTTSDAAYCWGWNRYGQIGDGGAVGVRLQPVLVAGGHAFRQVDAATAHTCGVTTGYRAFCWGFGRRGQIGDGKTYLRFTPRAVAGGLSLERVSVGNSQSCGETTTNRAYCWGSNESGGLGDGTRTLRLTPVAVVGGLTFDQVSTGGWHTCGKTPQGALYCWGENGIGQLGDGTTTDRLRPVPVAGAT